MVFPILLSYLPQKSVRKLSYNFIAALLLLACQPPVDQQSTTESFVQYMVAFKIKKNTSDEAVQQHMNDFASLQDKISELLLYEAGKTFTVPYKFTADYDVMHFTTFANEADMEVYFNHPDHQKFINDNKDSWDNVFVSNSRVE